MKPITSWRQLGQTQHKLLRTLLASPQGASMEILCEALGVTHNAVRQHLTALITAGLVARGSVQPSGGRPLMRYVLLPAGRDLFPRNYALIAAGLIEQQLASEGSAAVEAMLSRLGTDLGAAAASRIDTSSDDAIAQSLAAQLDALGYEAGAVRRDGEVQIEAWNCVFHALARTHPEVCRFDLAFMQRASGRPIQHMECLLRGGHACRFRIGRRDDER